jgi:tRNA G37 N-methylase Trm5
MDLILCCFVVLAYRLIFKYSTKERKKVTHAGKECEQREIDSVVSQGFERSPPSIIHFKCDNEGFMPFKIAIILRLFRSRKNISSVVDNGSGGKGGKGKQRRTNFYVIRMSLVIPHFSLPLQERNMKNSLMT